MMRKKQLACILAVMASFSCAVVPRTGKPSTALPSPADYSGNAAAYYHSEGIKASSINGDEAKAVEYYRKAIESDSLYAPAYFETAELLYRSDAGEALKFSRMAVRIDTTNSTYQSQLARMLVLSGNYEEALDLYSVLLRNDTHNPLNYSMLAALYDFKGQPFTAISILDSAQYKLGRIEELTAYKRQLLITTRQYDRAIEESMALIADYPYDDENYLILADIYAAKGSDSLALANYAEALSIDSTNVNTLMSLAGFHQARNNERGYMGTLRKIFMADGIPVETKIEMFDDMAANVEFYRRNYFAMNSLATTLQVRYPHDYRVMEVYATHLIRSGEIQTALGLYKSYSEGNPDSLEPYYSILDIESYLQRPDSVNKYSDMALARFPDNAELYLRKGFALDNMDREKDALKNYKQALRRVDTDSARSVITGIIGDTHHRHNADSKSFRAYEKALRYDPDNAVVLNNYAYYLSELDTKLDKALAMSTRANELSPSNSTYLDTQAWILYKLGRYKEAREIMLRAVSLDSMGSEVLLLHYGDILYELGEYFMAKTYWKRALDKGYDKTEIDERLKRPEK